MSTYSRDRVTVLVPAYTYNPAVIERIMEDVATDLDAAIPNRPDLTRWSGNTDLTVILTVDPEMEDDEVKNTLEALAPDLSWSRSRTVA